MECFLLYFASCNSHYKEVKIYLDRDGPLTIRKLECILNIYCKAIG